MVFLCLLLLAGPGLYRAPISSGPPETHGRPVWVFFTDKGISTDNEYQTALELYETGASAYQQERRRLDPDIRYDFDDLPVRTSYIRGIERLGGRLRAVSNWLNAASFDLPQAALSNACALPFVHDMKPVAVRTEREPTRPFPLAIPQRIRAQTLDTATAHRFYGPSYDQAQMMGVPELFFKGYFGAGVRLAIFDTGLKLRNAGVKGLRITEQHDFISGDNFQTAGSAGWSARQVDELRYLGLVRNPSLYLKDDRALLAFVADSFYYGYSAPRRALFTSHSTDASNSWSDPFPIVLSQQASNYSSHTFENLSLVPGDSATYLAYNDLLSNYYTRPQANVYVGYFTGDVWHSQAKVGPGRWPAVTMAGDTMLLACVESDSTLQFYKGSTENVWPNWHTPKTIRTEIPVTDLALAAGSSEAVMILGLDPHNGRLLGFRSTDRGETFSSARELVASGVSAFRLEQNGGMLYLFWEDESQPPLTRLNLLSSTDLGLNWTGNTTVIDNLLTIGDFATSLSAESGLTLLYETGGMLYRTGSNDAGVSWQPPALLDTAGFCCLPSLTTDGLDVLALWVKRGDDNTVWETSDTLKFSTEQPNHGTRMASIIAGFQQGSMIGVAPGVDLIIAKTEFYKTASSRYYEYNLEEDTYIEALEWAEKNGADIVSTSLGYRDWYSADQLDGKTAPISRAAGIAADKGIVVVTAMGNRDTTSYPWPKPYLTAPADAFGVISAGGVERSLLPWRGTGTGPTADGRCKPELVALSDTVTVVAPDSVSGLEGSVGTSCATALIAGCCALVKETHPSWSADSIKAALFSTATLSVQSCTFGFGVPQVDSVFKVFPPEPGVAAIARNELVAFPNPFPAGTNQRVYFAINLTRPSPIATIWIYTASGTLVDTIELNTGPISRPGHYKDIATLEEAGAFWDARNASGKPVASGLYLALLNTTSGGSSTSKFCLIR